MDTNQIPNQMFIKKEHHPSIELEFGIESKGEVFCKKHSEYANQVSYSCLNCNHFRENTCYFPQEILRRLFLPHLIERNQCAICAGHIYFNHAIVMSEYLADTENKSMPILCSDCVKAKENHKLLRQLKIGLNYMIEILPFCCLILMREITYFQTLGVFFIGIPLFSVIIGYIISQFLSNIKAYQNYSTLYLTQNANIETNLDESKKSNKKIPNLSINNIENLPPVSGGSPFANHYCDTENNLYCYLHTDDPRTISISSGVCPICTNKNVLKKYNFPPFERMITRKSDRLEINICRNHLIFDQYRIGLSIFIVMFAIPVSGLIFDFDFDIFMVFYFLPIILFLMLIMIVLPGVSSRYVKKFFSWIHLPHGIVFKINLNKISPIWVEKLFQENLQRIQPITTDTYPTIDIYIKTMLKNGRKEVILFFILFSLFAVSLMVSLWAFPNDNILIISFLPISLLIPIFIIGMKSVSYKLDTIRKIERQIEKGK